MAENEPGSGRETEHDLPHIPRDGAERRPAVFWNTEIIPYSGCHFRDICDSWTPEGL
jgi:hypothetical protein